MVLSGACSSLCAVASLHMHNLLTHGAHWAHRARRALIGDLGATGTFPAGVTLNLQIQPLPDVKPRTHVVPTCAKGARTCGLYMDERRRHLAGCKPCSPG